jgi:LacI family transcriptional regulator
MVKKDIAERVSVSSATVSLVLNGKEKGGRIGEEMSKRVELQA